MQDTLLFMTEDSVKRFVDAIVWFIPHSTKITDAFNVENAYYTPAEIEEMGAPKDKFPLFHIDLTLNDIDKLVYSTSPKQVVKDILKVFQHGVKQLQEIPQVEQKLLPHLFKSNQKNFLKATKIPESRPEEPDAEDPRAMADENAWIYE